MPNPAALKAGIRKGMVRVGKIKNNGKAFLKARGVMKKMMMICFALFAFISSNATIKIGGIEVSIERGKKEWNADKTATFCVGKGLCVIVVKGSLDIGVTKIPRELGSGILGVQDGHTVLVLPIRSIDDSYWKNLFVDNKLYVGSDILIDKQASQKIGSGCLDVIKTGSYSYKIQDETIVVYFN